ncbi:coiled-coil domain-containing protein 15 [Dunckerocampus dactyliophorus]|uniref:coiled-coil domain-containing protein 15 n=1 Tax=Dunckerocampus dactyliophorus TaxID=161453 RepID=UPI002404F65F|nr:coiled-coil domain-containing protein 15 [Dunckerocampus dactyliophorus]
MFGCQAKKGRDKAPIRRRQEHRTNQVMAERNQAVVAVGAWVEDGQEFEEHPCDLASFTDELQAETMREREEKLRRFQAKVRHRVAAISKRRHQEAQSGVKVDRRIPKQHHPWTQRETGTRELHDGARQVRLRLAARGTGLCDEMTSELPSDNWNVSLTRHSAESDVPWEEQKAEEEYDGREEDVDDGDDLLVLREEHKCPLVRHPVSRSRRVVTSGRERDADTLKSEPDLKSSIGVPKLLWPLPDQEELRRQRLSQFLMQRRHFMSAERERVKENKQHRKHLKKTARIKAEKEKARLEEESRLERTQQLAEVRQRLEEREMLVLERLKLEEEGRAAKLERRKRPQKGKVTIRYIDALRDQLKQRMSSKKLDLPPLCCCASSFWDSHPDSCANNCIFHNNPKEYAQALHSAVLTMDLQ